MNNHKNYLLIAFAIFSLLLTACGNSDDTSQSSQQDDSETDVQTNDGSSLSVTMAGASAGGLVQAIGEGYAKAVRTAYPDSTIGYEPGGVTDSIISVVNEEAEMAVAPSIVDLKMALEGMAPYEETYSEEDLYVLAKGDLGSAAHPIMRREFAEEHEITSIADVCEKKVPVRISLNKTGNFGVQKPARTLLEAEGCSIEEIESLGGEIVNGGSSTMVDLMKDNKLDMFITHGFPPHGKFLDLASTTDLIMLETSEEAVQEAIEEWGLTSYTIEASDYDFMENNVKTYAKDDYMLLSPVISDDEAYMLAKAYAENFDQFRQSYPALEDLKLEEMLRIDSSLKFHPGAKQYYEEEGLIE